MPISVVNPAAVNRLVFDQSGGDAEEKSITAESTV